MNQWQIGVDVGGTFTDIIAIDPVSGVYRMGKVPSTNDNQAKGVLNAVRDTGADLAETVAVVHGTTVGTNAVLERKGVVTAMITSHGMRDIMELGRRTRPSNYGMTGVFEALVDRQFRRELPERIAADGSVVIPLDEEALRTTLRELMAAGAESLVIHFLHSYKNPAHELRAAEIAREVWHNDYVTAGHEILPESREFERGSSASINAYIQPLMDRYLSRLATELSEGGFRHQLLVMQGNAGTMTARGAVAHAAQTVMSGPSAGALAAARIGVEAGLPDLIGCDMGGTSFEVTLIRDGEPSISAEKDIAYSVPLRVPMIDIHTIGAGGGSIARVNRAGILQVGPESAGSRPGPICYGRGGEEPTVTDANLLLGRLDPVAVAGVKSAASIEVVRATMLEKIGKPLGMTAFEAANAIIAIATNHLGGAIRLMTIERGKDPRDFALFAFGGAGPLHAVSLAAELAIPKVLVPRFPGATSALGCVLADLRHDFVQTIGRPLSEVDGIEMDAILERQQQRGTELIRAEEVPHEKIVAIHEADMLYRGQTHVFRIPVTSPGFLPEHTLETFTRLYRERFDVNLDGMIPVLANLRTTVLGVRPRVPMAMFGPTKGMLAPEPKSRREVYFGGTFYDTPIYQREKLPVGFTLSGPAIIEQFDTTTVVDPGAALVVDAYGNLIISVGDQQ